VRDKGVIAEIPRTERATHDLIDVDDARQFVPGSAYPVSDVCGVLEAFEVGGNRFARLRRRHPRVVQSPASGDSIQELYSPLKGWCLDNTRHFVLFRFPG
jgi:hypothetical protein